MRWLGFGSTESGQLVPRSHNGKVCLRKTYPEVNIEVSTATKLAIADLEGDGHSVIRVQLLVEAFARVCLQLDVVCRADGKETAKCGIEESEDEHVCCLWRIVVHKGGMERQSTIIV
jgi:hypothetical protein